MFKYFHFSLFLLNLKLEIFDFFALGIDLTNLLTSLFVQFADFIKFRLISDHIFNLFLNCLVSSHILSLLSMFVEQIQQLIVFNHQIFNLCQLLKLHLFLLLYFSQYIQICF